MRVYSQSQGRFIEKPDMPQAPGVSPGISSDRFQQAALMDLLTTGGKSLGKIETVSKLFAPAKEAKELESSITGGLSKLGEISSILDKYKGEDISGFGPSLKAKVFKGVSRESGLAKTFAPSQGTNILQAAISEYNTRLFEIAGKAFTGPEKNLLEGLILDISDDELRLRDKMTQAEKMISLKAQETGVEVPTPRVPEPTGVRGPISPQVSPTGQPSPDWREKAAQVAPFAGAMGGRLLSKALPLGIGQFPPVRGAMTGAGGVSGGRAAQVLRGQAPPEARQWGLAGRAPTGGEAATIGGGAFLETLLSPRKTIGMAKEFVLGQAKEIIPTESIIKAGNQYVKDNPLAKATWDKIKDAVKKGISGEELARKLEIWGHGFGKAGNIKDAAKNQLYAKLYQAGRTLLPGAAGGLTSAMRQTYQIPRKLGQAGWWALKGTVLGKMLGL